MTRQAPTLVPGGASRPVADATRPLLPPEVRAPSVRLQTLVNLRWLAITGQALTVIVANLVLSVDVNLLLCALPIGAAAAANLIATALRAPSHRLDERSAFIFLLFDLAQLTVLLFLTGGLNNPFALLFLAPVTISATALSLRATLALAVIAVALITFLGGYHLPLRLEDGTVMALPPLKLAGVWTAIVIGTLFQAGVAWRLTAETGRMSRALLATQTALEREQKLHDLGGVVAAAAHELGTPLATIKLVSSELVDELEDVLPERVDLQQDARLLREQADRCRDILRSMGRAGKADQQMRRTPLQALLREAAEPHADRGVRIEYGFEAPPGEPAGTASRAPQVKRLPETIHGLRNLIQNAVDFARETVWIDARWDDATLTIRVSDDGPGYSPEVLGRLGDPFLRTRRDNAGYEGMGLGLFISKTLLERTGARVTFANGSAAARRQRRPRGGAIAEVTWPRAAIDAPSHGALGENHPIAQ